MRKLALVSAFAAFLAATGLAAAQQAVVDDPPGSLYQNQGICDSYGDCDYWQPRPTHASNSQCESLFTLGGPGRCRCDVLTQASIRGFARHRESDSLAGCSCFRRFLPRCADAWTGFRTSVAG